MVPRVVVIETGPQKVLGSHASFPNVTWHHNGDSGPAATAYRHAPFVSRVSVSLRLVEVQHEQHEQHVRSFTVPMRAFSTLLKIGLARRVLHRRGYSPTTTRLLLARARVAQ